MNRFAAAIAVSAFVSPACAQSLFVRPVAAVSDSDPSFELRGYSMYYVEPPKPTEFNVHDILTIIVDEQTTATSSASLETSKEYDNNSRVDAFPDMQALIQDWAFRPGIDDPIELGITHDSEFKGEGDYDRSDRLVVRLSATVIDVKPNGNLVLEARKEVTTDDETRTMILTGSCRGLDVTRNNTVLSTQMADLRFELKNEGELRDASKRGVIPKIIEAIFNF